MRKISDHEIITIIKAATGKSVNFPLTRSQKRLGCALLLVVYPDMMPSIMHTYKFKEATIHDEISRQLLVWTSLVFISNLIQNSDSLNTSSLGIRFLTNIRPAIHTYGLDEYKIMTLKRLEKNVYTIDRLTSLI